MFSLDQFFNTLSNLAPIEYSYEFIAKGDYDNSGILVRSTDCVNKVLFTATLEDNTCEICGELDGKYFNLNNAPKIPIHPNCRCCHIPVVDDWKPAIM